MNISKTNNFVPKFTQSCIDISHKEWNSDESIGMVSSRLFEKISITGKGTAYILRRHNDAIKTPKTPEEFTITI